MTKERLSQLLYIRKEIARFQERLQEVRAQASSISASYEFMPKGSGTSDKVGKLAAAIVDLEQCLEEYSLKCIKEEQRLIAFISQIEESEIRLIFYYRYQKGYTWQKIAFETGAYDESVPRKKHNKYLLKIQKKA